VTWQTTSEINVIGFNVVLIKKGVSTLLNSAPIPCKGCSDGLPHSYAFPVAKHGGGGAFKFYVQLLAQGQPTATFGPAVRN
jgi:hypothetical protein